MGACAASQMDWTELQSGHIVNVFSHIYAKHGMRSARQRERRGRRGEREGEEESEEEKDAMSM